jgi:hypothetical protein
MTAMAEADILFVFFEGSLGRAGSPGELFAQAKKLT